MSQTREGRDILGEPKISTSQYQENLIKAQIAELIEGLTSFHIVAIDTIVHEISEYLSSNKIELLTSLREACEAICLPNFPDREFHDGRFWPIEDPEVLFEGIAAGHFCIEYVQHFVQNHKSTILSFHLGYLFFCASTYWYSRPSKSLPLTLWLASQGADLVTKQFFYDRSFWYRPVEIVLSSWIIRDVLGSEIYLDYRHEYDNLEVQKQTAEYLQLFLPLINDSADQCGVTLPRQHEWTFDFMELTADRCYFLRNKGL